MHIDRHRPTGRLAHHLAHQWNPRCAADEQDPSNVGELQLGGADSPLQRLHGVGDARPNHRFELDARQANVRHQVRERDRDRDVGIRRQGFLRAPTLIAQARERSRRGGVVAHHVAWLQTERLHHVLQDGMIEVDAADPLEALRLPDEGESFGGLAQQRCVERTATEVIHGDDLTDLDPLERGVVDRCGFGLRDERNGTDVGLPRRESQKIHLVVAERCWMAQHDSRRGLAVLLRHLLHDPCEHMGGQRLGAVGNAAEHQRRGITEATLEREGRAIRFLHGASFGGFTDEHLAVLADEHDRGDRGRARPQRAHLDTPRRGDGRGAVRRAEVDAQPVLHQRSPSITRSA
jgi:hypothetical protein